MPDLLRHGSFHPAPPDEIRNYKPMNDDVTIVPAPLRASVKIDSRTLDGPYDPCLRQGISRVATARTRQSR